MSSGRVRSSLPLDRILSLEIARVTERAAAKLRGRGNEKAADQAAVDAMRREMNNLAVLGTIVIGEGERDEAPMLFIGEKVGTGQGPCVDIAVDPLEGTTLCAKDIRERSPPWPWRKGAPCSTRPTFTWKRSPSVPAITKGSVMSRTEAPTLLSWGLTAFALASARMFSSAGASRSMLKGVRFREGLIETETVVMRSVTGTVRWTRAEHRQFGKFHLQ
jgi:fructose-1,6-bisphosphatase/sedoheptulose 1,7-bisphosphatase-like protein